MTQDSERVAQLTTRLAAIRARLARAAADAELRAAVEIASNWGTYVAAHAFTTDATQRAIAALDALPPAEADRPPVPEAALVIALAASGSAPGWRTAWPTPTNAASCTAT